MKTRQILWVTNLNGFKLHSVNRETIDSKSRNHIRKMAMDMKRNGFRFTEPIVVTIKDKDGKFFVIDGQHRLLAAIMAGVGLYYVVDESVKLTKKSIFEAFVKYNANKKIVVKNDYIHGYADMGNKNFTTLENFCKEFPMFSLTERMMLLQNSGTKHPNKEDFSNGNFTIVDTEIAKRWANNLLQLKPYFEKGYNKSVFVRTILSIMEKKSDFKFEEFLHKVKLRPSSIYVCGDKKSYAEMIEEIYNYRRRNDEKLNLRF
jgi:hypothetical protein